MGTPEAGPMSIVVTFATLTAAYACLAEIKRLYDAHVWLDVQLVRRADQPEVRVSARHWPQVRPIIRRFGGRPIH